MKVRRDRGGGRWGRVDLGAREAAIRAARGPAARRHEVTAVSPMYETEPLGPPQPRYLNAAFRLETERSPIELLSVLLRTERRSRPPSRR